MEQQELILTKEQIEILKEYLTRDSDNVICITLNKNSFLKQYNDRRRYYRYIWNEWMVRTRLIYFNLAI